VYLPSPGNTDRTHTTKNNNNNKTLLSYHHYGSFVAPLVTSGATFYFWGAVLLFDLWPRCVSDTLILTEPTLLVVVVVVVVVVSVQPWWAAASPRPPQPRPASAARGAARCQPHPPAPEAPPPRGGPGRRTTRAHVRPAGFTSPLRVFKGL